MEEKNVKVLEKVFEKCPVCKKGKVEFVEWKTMIILKHQDTRCNNCNAKFKYEGKVQEQDTYSLDLSESKEKNNYNNQTLKRSEWERGSSDIDSIIEHVTKTNKLPERSIEGVNIILQEGEKLHFNCFTSLLEERSVRVSYGGAVRVVKGVYVGGSQGQSHGELKKVDSGYLTLTNKRLIFNGELRNIEFKLNKIVSVEEFSDAIEIGASNRNKIATFIINEPKMRTIFIRIAVKNYSKNK